MGSAAKYPPARQTNWRSQLQLISSRSVRTAYAAAPISILALDLAFGTVILTCRM